MWWLRVRIPSSAPSLMLYSSNGQDPCFSGTTIGVRISGRAPSLSLYSSNLVRPSLYMVEIGVRISGRVSNYCSCGGIGRHAVLRSPCLRVCRFDSYYEHQVCYTLGSGSWLVYEAGRCRFDSYRECQIYLLVKS